MKMRFDRTEMPADFTLLPADILKIPTAIAGAEGSFVETKGSLFDLDVPLSMRFTALARPSAPTDGE
jgi:hypothetical protein